MPSPMKRPGLGRSGQAVDLYCNHYAAQLSSTEDVYQYDVTISFADDIDKKQIISTVLCRKVMYSPEVHAALERRKFVFDGEKTLYVAGPLQNHLVEMDVPLPARPSTVARTEVAKKQRCDAKNLKLRIAFTAKVEMRVLASKQTSTKVLDALRVLDVLLREQAARRGYLLLRNSYFDQTLGEVKDLGEGVCTWKGFHASFRVCSNGVSLNLDPSTTALIKPVFVHEFIGETSRKRVNMLSEADVTRAKRVLNKVEVEVYAGSTHKIRGFSPHPASSQTFDLKTTNGENRTITVEQYYKERYRQTLSFPNLQCVNVGKATKPVYIPMEFCKIKPGQRYPRKLSGNQIRIHLADSRQNPEQKLRAIEGGLKEYLKNSEDILKGFNVRVDNKMLRVQGRVLAAPMLKFGQRVEEVRLGQWNFNTRTVARSIKTDVWVAVSFGRIRHQEASDVASKLQQVCQRKGVLLANAKQVYSEDPGNQGWSPVDRVMAMVDLIKKDFEVKPPSFILCILPQKDSDIYGPFKTKFTRDVGVVTQCMVPPRNLNDQYLTNLMLKINAKTGGYNSVLAKEFDRQLPKISSEPTMILGMDVSHSSSKSVAAVVGSRDWPRISQYAARVRTQSARCEAIANLSEGEKGGMICELIKEFVESSRGELPSRLLIFRDGVSESQFDSVLTVELEEVIKAFNNFKEGLRPKVTLIVAQKRHHTRFFPATGNLTANILPGTVVDSVVCHPTDYDFFLSSHKGLIGTTRPTHYVVLHDENEFTPDEVQTMVNNLCYTYARSTTAVSVVAPIFYAHLAAQKCRAYFSNEEEWSDSGSQRSTASAAATSAPATSATAEVRIHKRLESTMFFL